MRRRWMMVVLGLALATGCGGSGREVRVTSSVGGRSTQQALDGVAASLFNQLLGGPR